ncbi:MAG: hypothetical protein MZV65_33770 [Chromatiales bacterium]|nr:hypothetical protein [Chromatiales bacterium]
MTDTSNSGNPADNEPLWNNLSRVLFVVGLALGGLAAYLYWGYGQQLREAGAELDEKNREIALENERLREHVGYLTERLDEEVAKVSRQKEEEIARMRATHDDMVKTLQKEIDQGQIKVTQLADRLSLNIVDKILSLRRGPDHRPRQRGAEARRQRTGSVQRQDHSHRGPHRQRADRQAPAQPLPEQLGAVRRPRHQCRALPRGATRHRPDQPGGGRPRRVSTRSPATGRSRGAARIAASRSFSTRACAPSARN